MLRKTVTLPASKSESNRALMIAAYGGFVPDFRNLSDSNDTKVLQKALRGIEENASVIDVADCGAAARFLTTLLACHKGEWVLTGTERMKQRPIKPLVDALKQLGAEIKYEGIDGFLPLHIQGDPIKGGKVAMDMTQSSQFASSLLLAAPMWPLGIEMELNGMPSSLPYLEMTHAMMHLFGAEFERVGKTIRVKPKPYHFSSFSVSPDWTAASYWYEIAAFSKECEIRLKSLGLSKDRPNLQGDSIISDWMRQLGVGSFIEGEDVVLRKIPYKKRTLSFDFTHYPDLYPTLVATCAGLGMETEFVGLDNLRHKESDRVDAMQTELAKIGQAPLHFSSHNDHRVVMSLAPLSMLFGPVSFDYPEAVSKSYPGFWDDASFLRE